VDLEEIQVITKVVVVVDQVLQALLETVHQILEDQEEMVLHLLFQVSQELHHPHL
tara:strand:- start:266 stop:430 length:165 start_codon:yes stop_codon:yes gene_type:complete